MDRTRAYIRLSKFREGDDKLSPQVQLDMARNICQARGWVLDEDASIANQDLDVSGYSLKWRERPGLMRHFEDAKAGKFDRLVIYAVDRLGRNTADTLNAWDEFERYGVTVYSVRESLDSSTAFGTLLRNISASFAEMESSNTSARIKANVEARAKAGRLHGGRLPAWLMRDADNNIIINEPVADAVRLAAALRIEGYSYTYITREINRRGHRTASGTQYNKSWIVKLFSWDWVETMYGTAYTRRRGRHATDHRTGRRTSRGEPIAIPNAYPPIIDEQTYQRLLVVATAKNDDVKTKDRASERWMLNGVFRCSVCGGRMGVHSRKRPDGTTRRTYFCESHNDDPSAVEHPISRVDGDMVELAVLVALSPMLTLIERELPTAKPRPVMRSEREVRKELDRVVGLYAKGTIDEAALDARVATLNDELSAIARLAAVEEEPLSAPKLTSRVAVRKWLQQHHVEVSYPVFIEGEAYPTNWRQLVPTPVPFVRLIWSSQISALSPVYRNGVRPKRKIYEERRNDQPFGYWTAENPMPEVPRKSTKVYEVEVTEAMVKLARQ
jgi:DNA invertase Pin-like site-specific DNA recombinase